MIIECSTDGSGTARFSDDRRYRYALRRHLNDNRSTFRTCVFVMLNPSTADAFTNDHTIRRCILLAGRWGFDAIDVVNLFALTTSDPDVLFATPSVERGGCTVNDAHILSACAGASMVIAAWGNGGWREARDVIVADRLRGEGVALHRLGATKSGRPIHPGVLGKIGKCITQPGFQPEVWL